MPTEPSIELSDKIISFSEGLPGFPDLKEFVMSQLPEERPFAWMHALGVNKVSFAIVDAFAWLKEFSLEVDDSVLQQMGSTDPLDYAVYFILKMEKQDGRTVLQANAKGPLMVNVKTRRARQVLINENPSLAKAEALCLQV
jgi:flagellar assembly factor FliW